MESGDPRLSVDELYASKQGYPDKVETAAHGLVHGGYLLEREVAG